MALLETYDPKKVAITFAPANSAAVPINSVVAPDTFISVSRDEDSFFKTVGADGTVARTRNANRSGTIEITLMQNSEVNRSDSRRDTICIVHRSSFRHLRQLNSFRRLG